MIPARAEASRIPVLAINNSGLSSSNPSSAMKIAIVKPIPARNETPAICENVVPVGSRANPSFRAGHPVPVIPTNLPTSRPPAIPKATGLDMVCFRLPASRGIPALSNANVVITRKDTGSYHICSRRCRGCWTRWMPSSSVCTADCSRVNHNTTAIRK